MKRRWNGGIQSSNTPYYNAPGISRTDYNLYRCIITDVLYVDDPRNITKNAPNPEVLYNCIILGGSASGQQLSNCRLARYLTLSERTLTPTSKNISKVRLSENDGDIVWVQFIQGHDGYPLIVSIAIGLADMTGAKKADGPRLLETFNGLTNNINNKGEYSQTMMGGATKEGRFTANKESLIKEEWLTTEQLLLTFKSGLKLTFDGKNDKVTQKFAGGLEASYDGKNDKAEIKTTGAVVTIDGKSKKVSITVGATEVTIDGNSGKITLKGEMIDLGASVADFVTQFTQLATAFATHMHLYSPGPGGPTPTSPPMAPLLVSVGSQTVKVQP